MRLRTAVLSCLILSLLSGCTSTPTPPSENVVNYSAIPTSPVEKVRSDDCVEFDASYDALPTFIADGSSGIFVTRMTKPCRTSNRRNGYLKTSQWMAMGIPCTGPKSPVQVFGRIFNPNKLAFALNTSCAIKPESVDDVRALGEKMNLQQSEGIAAYNPLAVQAWEIVGYNEFDLGSAVELRSPNLIKEFWNDFRAKNKPLPVRLYGHENAWVRDDTIYVVEGQILFEQPNHFRLSVSSGRPLSKDEVASLRQRCENLRLNRNCKDSF